MKPVNLTSTKKSGDNKNNLSSGGSKKPIVVVVITLGAILVLFLLVMFGKQFVGKAIESTPLVSLQPGEIGIDPYSISGIPNDEFTITIKADTGSVKVTSAITKVIYDSTKLEVIEAKSLLELKYGWPGGQYLAIITTKAGEVFFSDGFIPLFNPDAKILTGKVDIFTVKFKIKSEAKDGSEITLSEYNLMEGAVNAITSAKSSTITIKSADDAPPVCTPSCTGKTCGDDGCGGSCGTCPSGFNCDGSACVSTVEVCGNKIDDDNDNLIDCTDYKDCSGKSCGLGCICFNKLGSTGVMIKGKKEILCTDQISNDGDAKIDCADTDCAGDSSCIETVVCTPSCTDKTCGDDGCGGSCGSCVAGETCSNNACVQTVEICDNGKDEDGDTLLDCTDYKDCSGKSCGLGCICFNKLGSTGVMIKGKKEILCTDQISNDGDAKIDCADSDCVTDPGCAGYCTNDAICGIGSKCENNICVVTETCLPKGDLNNDQLLDGSDVNNLLYVLDAQSETDCGGTGQAVCDYSTDGYFVCKNGIVYGMADENDLTHKTDFCSDTSCTPIGDLNNDQSLSGDDVTAMLYVLDAQSKTDCGGTGQTICDYSGDGYFVCKNGIVYGMADENDLTHALDKC